MSDWRVEDRGGVVLKLIRFGGGRIPGSSSHTSSFNISPYFTRGMLPGSSYTPRVLSSYRAVLTINGSARFSNTGCRGWLIHELVYMEVLTFVVEVILVIRRASLVVLVTALTDLFRSICTLQPQ